jgi:dienelactone hydrolase
MRRFPEGFSPMPLPYSSTQRVVATLTEVRFTLEVADETVPGVAFYPADAEGPLPLVVIQHPGTSSKDDYFVTDVARMWAPRGWICAGIDAPFHGERRDHDPMALFRDRDRYPEIVAQFANELSATLDALIEHLPVDTSRIGFVGYSMGSMLGVPAVAMDGRYRAAAFCLVGEGGLTGPAAGPESFVPRLASVAVKIEGKNSDE